MIPGEYVHPDEPVVIDRPRTSLVVVNSGDRPVQVGSHYHFAAANPALLFDREVAAGKRLAVPAGTAVRFEPGVEKAVELVELGGTKTVPGLRLHVTELARSPSDTAPLGTTRPSASEDVS